MGLTRQYLRFEARNVFNGIAGTKAGVRFLPKNLRFGRRPVVTGVCEYSVIWDLRSRVKVKELQGGQFEATALLPSEDGRFLAVGYKDGSLQLWRFPAGQAQITFSGHRTQISSLAFDHSGMRLASGSKDSTLIVWDVVAERGLYRLHGHKGSITRVHFLTHDEHHYLASSSQDAVLKIWDLNNGHSIATLAGHKTPVWDFTIVRDTFLITGCGDSELRVWEIDFTKLHAYDIEEEVSGEHQGPFHQVGTLMRESLQRVHYLTYDEDSGVMACNAGDGKVELWMWQSEDEAKLKRDKRLRKERKRMKKNLTASVMEDQQESLVSTESSEIILADRVLRLSSLSMRGKVRGLDISATQSSDTLELSIVCVLSSNKIEFQDLRLTGAQMEVLREGMVEGPGHASDVRVASFSSDGRGMFSASAESLKLWLRGTEEGEDTVQCIRTITCDYALCGCFAPGDRHVLLGTKSGKIQIFDVNAGTLIEDIEAHGGLPVWSLALYPNMKGIVSGGEDKTVKFWDFELMGKQLSLIHMRTLELKEDVLCVKVTPDGRLLAVSLLDSSIQIFYMDTLKFFLSLYGHRLPALTMDVSGDSTLIATGGADKNLRIWGLDFGDCHKSLLAAEDSIMGIHFIPDTHLVFVCSKDGSISQWDADHFTRVATLKGHKAEVWTMSVTQNGWWLLSASHDKTLRLWEKTDEILVLEEEQEREREEEVEQELAVGGVLVGETNKEVQPLLQRKALTEKSVDFIMECLSAWKEEDTTHMDQLSLILGLKPPVSPRKFIRAMVVKLETSELESTLLALPRAHVMELFEALVDLCEENIEAERVTGCLCFLARVHQGILFSHPQAPALFQKAKDSVSRNMKAMEELVGFNVAGLEFLQMKLEEKGQVELFLDATQSFKEKKRKKKRRFLHQQRALLTL